MHMITVFDVADWFLSKESMTPKKLQKLCYYFKAWGLALYGKDFLPESHFEAWVHGPVCPELYQKYKGYYWRNIRRKRKGNTEKFNPEEQEILSSVWYTYGEMSANALEAQTHAEVPWQRARAGADEFMNSTNPIRNNDMKEYYRTLYEAHQGE